MEEKELNTKLVEAEDEKEFKIPINSPEGQAIERQKENNYGKI